jgi:hypothetical protein
MRAEPEKNRLNMAQSDNRLPSEPDVYVADSSIRNPFGEERRWLYFFIPQRHERRMAKAHGA